MILATQGGTEVVGGLAFDEINDVYKLGLPVEVEGHLFELEREGQTYPVFHVKRIKVQDREKLPLVVYHSQHIRGRYTSEVCFGIDRISFPQEFYVGRNVTGIIWKDMKHAFEIILNPGDRVRIRFNSSDPIFFGLYAPNSTKHFEPARRWGVPMLERNETKQLDLIMDVFERGTYVFLFDAKPTSLAEVKFNCQKITTKTMDLLFMEEGSHSTDTGGMGSSTFYPQPLPSKIVIGRTWSKSGAWTDHSYSYKTELNEDDLIRIQYNATQSIHFSYKSKNKVIESVNKYSFETIYEVASNGTHSFEFDVEEPKTAIVSFKCEKIKGSHYIAPRKNDLPVSFFPYKESVNEKGKPRFPPRFEKTSLRGKLNVATFPMKNLALENVLVIDSFEENQTRTHYMHVGVGQGMIAYPDGGYTRIGNYSLFAVVQAYEKELLVEVDGFPFSLERNNTVYEMFHLNSFSVLEKERLPLYARHNWDLVVGRQTSCYDDDEPNYFPVSFRLGPELYEDGFGNPEHFYFVFLNKDERILFTFNATAPVEFGLYTDHSPYTPGVMSFYFGKPEDYLIRESGVESYQKEIMANRTSYYSFAFKAFRGKKSEVIFDCMRIK